MSYYKVKYSDNTFVYLDIYTNKVLYLVVNNEVILNNLI